MAISVIGLDFRTAKVELREQLALNREQVLGLLAAIIRDKMLDEAVVLSTCNRMEVYFAGAPAGIDPLPRLLEHIAQVKHAAPVAHAQAFFRHDGEPAVRRLFRVAASLESQVVGEHEIMGQVKDAYLLSCHARASKFLMHKLLHGAFRAGKRVMSETTLGQGTASVPQAAVELAKRALGSLAGKTAMLVGAGQTAELAAQAMIRDGIAWLIVANRTAARALALAKSFIQFQHDEHARDTDGIRCPALLTLLAQWSVPIEAPRVEAELSARAIGLDDIPAAIGGVDLVISSTGADKLLNMENVGPALAGRKTALVMIDIAVPRDIDERLGSLPGVRLHNIDGLESIVAANLDRRAAEVPRAEAIVDEEVGEFLRWHSSLGAVPTMRDLEQRIIDLQIAELARHNRKFAGEDRAALEEFARSLCNKILHGPRAFLRQTTGDSHADIAAISMLRRVFNLDGAEDGE